MTRSRSSVLKTRDDGSFELADIEDENEWEAAAEGYDKLIFEERERVEPRLARIGMARDGESRPFALFGQGDREQDMADHIQSGTSRNGWLASGHRYRNGGLRCGSSWRCAGDRQHVDALDHLRLGAEPGGVRAAVAPDHADRGVPEGGREVLVASTSNQYSWIAAAWVV